MGEFSFAPTHQAPGRIFIRPYGTWSTTRPNTKQMRPSPRQQNSRPVSQQNLLRPGTAEAEVVVDVRRIVDDATRRAEVIVDEAEAAAAYDPARAASRTDRVRCWTICVISAVVPIRYPFPHVSRHIAQSVRTVSCRGLTADIHRTRTTIHNRQFT